jgi:CRISPR-associated protein (TIGR03986 family)
MRLPRQPKEIVKERQALAPYNFVALPDRIVKVSSLSDELKERFPQAALPRQDSFNSQRHSGRIECTLTTSSPTYVRAALTIQQVKEGMKSKDTPDFFYVEPGIPVIPGSTLRGMLHAALEIVSYSKVSQVSATPLVYRAVGDTTSHGDSYRDRVMRVDKKTKKCEPKVLGGYMVKRGSDWFIRPAKMIKGSTFGILREPERASFYFRDLRQKLELIDGCRNAYRVFVRLGEYEYQKVGGGFDSGRLNVFDSQATPKSGWIEGTLALSGTMASKRSEAVIFAPDSDARADADLLKLTDDQVAAYREQKSKEQEKILGKDGALNDGQPIFYTLNDDSDTAQDKPVEFFGHCRMLRLPYPKSPLDFVPQNLRAEDEIDLTEAIFGFTKNSRSAEPKAYAGRVSFSDAQLLSNPDDVWLAPHRPITPKILGSPKPTCFQHYLVQPTPNKFEIGKDRRGKPKYETRLADYGVTNTVIRGNKLYWHKGEATLKDIELEAAPDEKSKDNVSTSIRPLRAGVDFRFEIRFDNLSDVELGSLLWILKIAANDGYRLKLGMGKPLGLGAVKIDSTLRLIDRAARYAKLFDDSKWSEGVKDEREVEDVRQRSVAEFERFVIAQVDQPGVRNLVELDRIQEFLLLMSWPGPAKERTRYMEISLRDPREKSGKRNEYRRPEDRPVLPPPAVVVSGEPAGATRPTSPVAPVVPGEKLLAGEVKAFGLGPQKSYGFIKPDVGGPDVYVPLAALPEGIRTLVRGKRVRYVLLEDGEESTRPKAKKVLV